MKKEQLIQDMAAGIVHYENAAIPLRIKEYSVHENREEYNIPHWHDDFELMQVLEGVCEYKINDDLIYIQNGDFLFVNARVMHKTKRHGDSPLTGRCLLFRQGILSPNPMIQEKYLESIRNAGPFEYIYFPRNTKEADICIRWMNWIYEAKHESLPAYEMEALAGLHAIMACIYRYISRITPAVEQKSEKAELEKKMLSFIYHQYADKITLTDIASSASISVHRCCEIFKENVGYSPVEYLNYYRLHVAAKMLLISDKPVQEIALSNGFESAAYFTKQFKKQFQKTPKEYRKMHG